MYIASIDIDIGHWLYDIDGRLVATLALTLGTLTLTLGTLTGYIDIGELTLHGCTLTLAALTLGTLTGYIDIGAY